MSINGNTLQLKAHFLDTWSKRTLIAESSSLATGHEVKLSHKSGITTEVNHFSQKLTERVPKTPLRTKFSTFSFFLIYHNAANSCYN